MLATGGAGRLYRITTNSSVVTGDGVALGFRAGAEVMDMEFFQFHPTALRLPDAPPFLISEAVRGEGGVLLNVDEQRFMERYAGDGELAARDIVARAIVAEMRATGADNVLLDVRHLDPGTVTSRFPSIYQFCLQYGLDITKEPIPVAPAAHYMMGGLRVTPDGRTNVPGLLAAGETACTGAHGANRLASNSLAGNAGLRPAHGRRGPRDGGRAHRRASRFLAGQGRFGDEAGGDDGVANVVAGAVGRLGGRRTPGRQRIRREGEPIGVAFDADVVPHQRL